MTSPYILLNKNKKKNWRSVKFFARAILFFIIFSLFLTFFCMMKKHDWERKFYLHLDFAFSRLAAFYTTYNTSNQHSESGNAFIVCYYTLPWNVSPTYNLQPHEIDANICTHIIIGFASVNNCSLDLGTDSKIYESVVALKQTNSELKILLSVGSAAAPKNTFENMTKNHATRKVFIRSVLKILQRYKMDGLDIDWEFPSWLQDGKSREKIHFVQLLQELRRAFDRSGRQLLLSAAVGAPQAIVDQCYNVAQIAEHVDFVNLMSYDYHFFTDYFPVTDLNAPLYYKDADNSSYLASLNINFSANYWLSKGMPRDKMVIGIPTYGHTFKLYNSQNHHLGAPAKGFGQLGEEGYVSYSIICLFLESEGATRIYVNRSKVPYAYKDTEWISYDDVDSVTIKAKWIKEQSFKGAMIFSLNTDNWSGTCKENTTFPLTRAISEILVNDSSR